MTDNNEVRQIRLKQLRFRSAHRGVAEMDQIMGAFAASGLAGLNDAQLDQYQALLDAPDWDAFAWVTGKAAPPGELAEIVALVVAHGKTIAG